VGKFTEAWYASESLVNRTQQKKRAMNAAERTAAERAGAYEALNQQYVDDDIDSGRANMIWPNGKDSDFEDEDGPINVAVNRHPNPLRLNPPSSTPPRETGETPPRQKTPFRLRDALPVLTEMSPNRRSVSGSQDIADVKHAPAPAPAPSPARRPTILGTWGRTKGNRSSSIQLDDQFCSKPYGDLRSATPPIMYGGEKVEAKAVEGRQVSSGNDFDLGSTVNLGYRRNVSGKVAEEGMAGPTTRYSRYSVLNE
jgi:hypothetical protein